MNYSRDTDSIYFIHILTKHYSVKMLAFGSDFAYVRDEEARELAAKPADKSAKRRRGSRRRRGEVRDTGADVDTAAAADRLATVGEVKEEEDERASSVRSAGSDDDSASDDSVEGRARASSEISIEDELLEHRLADVAVAFGDVDVDGDRAGEAAPPTAAAAAPPSGVRGFFSGLFGGGSSHSAAPAAAAPSGPTFAPGPQRRRRAKHKVAVDTNIISLNMRHLAEAAAPATGDPVFCTGCGAAMSSLSNVRTATGVPVFGPEAQAAREGKAEETADSAADDAEQHWACEFCGTDNVVDVDEEEFPSESSLEYLLEGAPAAEATGSAGGDAVAADDSIVAYVLDTSGSMCVSHEVEGTVAFKGDRRDSMRSLLARGDGDQQLPGQRRDVTYVSRLQAVQAAVTTQIAELKREHPNRRVALITFSGEVVLVGDGTGDSKTLAGDRLESQAQMLAAGAEATLPGPVNDTAEDLCKKVFALEEGGATALGPAVTAAIGLAGRKPGSRIVLCTDGVANIGLGSLEATEEDVASVAAGRVDADGEVMTAEDIARERAVGFYTELGRAAADAGVAIDVIGIEGEGCDLESLGTTLAEPTAGNVQKVNPTELRKNFATSLANPIIAMKTRATLLLHWGLAFRGDDVDADRAAGGGAGGSDGEPAASSKRERDIGNVTSETVITFEYGQRSRTELGEERAAALRGVKELPFQLQVRYTRPDGASYVRVMTEAKPVTHERATAEARMDMRVCGTHAAQSSAAMARAGDYTTSRVRQFAMEKMMRRNIASEEQAHAYSDWTHAGAMMDDAVLGEQKLEREEFGRSLSDDEDDDEGELSAAPLAGRAGGGAGRFGSRSRALPDASKKKKKGKARSARRHGKDALSAVLQQASRSSVLR